MRFRRIVIAGGPLCGKSTRAHELGGVVLHADPRSLDRSKAVCGPRCQHLREGLDWSSASAEVAAWFNAPGPWVIEGVACARALRKWLATHPIGKPCDQVVLLTKPFVQLMAQQTAMAKGCETVWREISGTLRMRGVEIL
jgi:hypothetical protein